MPGITSSPEGSFHYLGKYGNIVGTPARILQIAKDHGVPPESITITLVDPTFKDGKVPKNLDVRISTTPDIAEKIRLVFDRELHRPM